MSFDPEIVSIKQLGMRNGRPKLIAPPKLRTVIKRSCRNCGWKLTNKPVIVEMYGYERVDQKVRSNGHKWCVIFPKRPSNGCCSEWNPKRKVYKE